MAAIDSYIGNHLLYRYHFFAKRAVAPICHGVFMCRTNSNPVAVLLYSMMDPQSPQAASITRLTNYFFIAAAFILGVVCILTILFLRKYRAKPDDDQIPPKIFRSKKLEAIIVGVPLAMVAFFFVLTLSAMRDILPDAGNARPEVIITGHQWWWGADYPQYGVSTANEIHLPVGRKILLRLLSADVIHDWWVPQLGNKMDLIPGRANHLWLTINKPGYYEGACSEFCGQQHAWMRIRVYAETETAYQQWLATHKSVASAPTDGLAIQGAQIFQQKTCGSCHRINGTAAAGTAGPELTHLASRQTLLTGLLPNDKKSLDAWLEHPRKVKPGANMPDFLLDKPSRDALVAYLMQLK